jgi:hypothetical protein
MLAPAPLRGKSGQLKKLALERFGKSMLALALR